MNERDIENGEVASLLGQLPRVEAPGDFDFGVRARIAAANSTRQTSFLPFLKVAAPLSLLLLVGTFVILYGFMPGETPDAVAEVSAPQDQPISLNPERVPAQEITPPVAEQRPVVPTVAPVVATIPRERRRNTTVRRVSRPQPIAVRQGGSVDIALGIPIVIEKPDVPVRGVLQRLGIEAEFVDGEWKVLSTTDNSIAMRSGVRPNDVIEAIDGQAITEGTKLKGSVEGKSLNLRREAKQVKVDLKN